MYNKSRSQQQQQSDRVDSSQQFSNHPQGRFDGPYRDSMGSQNYYQGQQQGDRQNFAPYQRSSSAPYQQYYGSEASRSQPSQQWQQHEVPPPSSYGRGQGVYHPTRSMNEGVYRPDSYSSSGIPQSSEQIGSRYYGDQSGSNYGNTQGVWGSPNTPSLYGEHTGKGPKNYRRSEERIREDVCEVLAHHGGIDASEIEVSVSEGVVTLSGSVDSRQMKRMAEEAIDHLAGVQDIKNEIKVEDSSAVNRRYMSEGSSTEASRGFSSSSPSLNASKTAPSTSTGRTSSAQTSATKQ